MADESLAPRRLRRAYDTMPIPIRDVFDRHRFEGLTYSEIAADLGIEIGAVERRLARALSHLDRETGKQICHRRGRIWAWLCAIFTRIWRR